MTQCRQLKSRSGSCVCYVCVCAGEWSVLALFSRQSQQCFHVNPFQRHCRPCQHSAQAVSATPCRSKGQERTGPGRGTGGGPAPLPPLPHGGVQGRRPPPAAAATASTVCCTPLRTHSSQKHVKTPPRRRANARRSPARRCRERLALRALCCGGAWGPLTASGRHCCTPPAGTLHTWTERSETRHTPELHGAKEAAQWGGRA